MSFVAFPRPYGARDAAVLLLYQFGQEEQTGLTSTALTLEHAPIPGSLLLFKNGTKLREVAGAAGFAIEAAAVTLGTAAVAGDVFEAMYHYSSAREG